jgi:AcrR family transcriptional regulator
LSRAAIPQPGDQAPSPAARPLRADAQINYDRLLEAAARAFAREGPQASLKAIAKDAGVGIGTLYRRFPTRDRLIEATYRDEVAALCAAASELLQTLPPAQALRAWMDRFVDFMATKHRMAPALRTVLVTDGDQRMRTRDLLTDAVATLLAAGVADKTIRPDIDPEDVLMSAGGVILIAGEPGQRDLANRLLDLLLDGLKYRGDPADRDETASSVA